MSRPLILLAAAGLVLSACAPTRPEPVRTVFLSGPGVHHVTHHRAGGDRVVVVRHRDGGNISAQARADARRHAEHARRHAEEARRLAFASRLGPQEIDRITREARAAAEAGRRAGEEGRRAGEAGRRAGEAARRAGEAARLRGEEARRRGEEMRLYAERLRRQCERGEIKCEIIEGKGSRTITIIR